jgi:nitroreductase
MELMEVIKERRTVRAFRPDPVDPKVLEEVLSAAIWAPSHFNAQPWEFIHIGKETRQKLQKIFHDKMEGGPLKDPNLPEEKKSAMRKFILNFGDAPVLTAVICPPPVKPTDHVDYPLAAGAAIQNILLSAWEKQLGGVWLSLGQYPESQEVLQIKEGYRVIGILAMGYFDAAPPLQPRTPISEKITLLP